MDMEPRSVWDEGSYRLVGEPTCLYHVTTPQIAQVILRDGFKDHACEAYSPFEPLVSYPPGVWFSDMPIFGMIEYSDYFDHADEAWIRIPAMPDLLAGGEMFDVPGWFGRSWLLPAARVNILQRFEMLLHDVMAYRVKLDAGEVYGPIIVPVLHDTIQEMTDAKTKARWQAALVECT